MFFLLWCFYLISLLFLLFLSFLKIFPKFPPILLFLLFFSFIHSFFYLFQDWILSPTSRASAAISDVPSPTPMHEDGCQWKHMRSSETIQYIHSLKAYKPALFVLPFAWLKKHNARSVKVIKKMRWKRHKKGVRTR